MNYYIYLFLITYAICYVLIDSYIFNYFRNILLYKSLKIENKESNDTKSFIEVLTPRNIYFVELFKCYFCLGFWVGLFIYSIGCGLSYEIVPKALANSAALYLVQNFVFRQNTEDVNE